MAEHHNVSVRLNEEDYKQLLFLHDKFNRMSYGKVSLADVLRLAVKELYLVETKDNNKPVTLEQQQENVIQQLEVIQAEKDNADQEQEEQKPTGTTTARKRK